MVVTSLSLLVSLDDECGGGEGEAGSETEGV